MKLNIVLFSTIAIFSLVGCTKDTTAPPVLNSTGGSKITMFTDYNSIQLFTDSLTLQRVDVNNDTLHLLISYGGGCKDHQFALYGAAVFLKSNPPQAEIYLSHNGNADSCKALITQEIRFILDPLLSACKQQFGSGQILLRIHLPKSTDPIQPFASVLF